MSGFYSGRRVGGNRALTLGPVSFPESFPTARLRAERLTPDHVDAIRAMDSDPKYMALLGGPRTESQTREYMTRNLKHWEEHDCGLWVLRDLEGEIAGRCVLRHLDVEGTDEVELGYGLHTPYWGRGLATEIARELLRLGREQLHRPTIVAVTRPDNHGSQRVLVKTGLVFEREILYDGVPHLLFRSGTVV